MLKILRNVHKILYTLRAAKFSRSTDLSKLSFFRPYLIPKNRLINANFKQFCILTSGVGFGVLIALCDSKLRYEEKRFFRTAQYGLLPELKK